MSCVILQAPASLQVLSTQTTKTPILWEPEALSTGFGYPSTSLLLINKTLQIQNQTTWLWQKEDTQVSKLGPPCVTLFHEDYSANSHAAAKLFSGSAVGAITCQGVLTTLTPCISYAQRGGYLPVTCCDGFRALNAAASTTPDLQAACRCVISLVSAVGGNPGFVNDIPFKCGVPFPYKYYPSLDCATVHR